MAIKNNGMTVANQLRALYKDFYKDGKENIRATGDYADLPTANMTLLKMVFELIFKYNITCNEMRLYIKYGDKNYRQITDIVMEGKLAPGEEVSKGNYTNTYNKIRNSCVKLIMLFGDSFVTDLAYKRININIDEYANRIGEIYSKYNKSDILKNNLIVDIPKDVIFSECDQTRFVNMLSKLRPYTVKSASSVVDSLDRQAVGYLNYLISTQGKISEYDEVNFKLLNKLFGVEDNKEDG